MNRRLQLLALVALAALLAVAADELRLTVYAPQASYSVIVVERNGHEYVSLLDVLVRLGNATADVDRDKWTLHFNSSDSEFKAGKDKAKIRGKNTGLPAPFLIENNNGLAPVEALPTVLSRLLDTPVTVRSGGRRVFIGSSGTLFTANFEKSAGKLVLRFSAPVNPTIANDPGRLRLTFNRDPVIAGVPSGTFDDKTITSFNFSEANGTAELTIHGGAPLMATFGDGNKTITVAPAPAPAQVAHTAPAAAPPASSPPAAPPAPAPAAPSPEAVAPARRALVVIDPGHGGDDRGAALTDALAEKNVTLAWAKRLHAALAQKGISATLLRESDISLTLDQRAALANAARPLVFITLHAGSVGNGVRVYTAHLGEVGGRNGAFLPWSTAQAAYLDSSRVVAGSIAAEFNKRDIPFGTAPVFLHPLNNVAAPAIAVEIMPPGNDVSILNSGNYQQAICTALAEGIAAVPAVRAALPKPATPAGAAQ